MKNQYFGNSRDLFKFDLILTIMRECPSVKLFAYIPMLTRDENSAGEGKPSHTVAEAGTRNKELKAFLEENRRDIAQIAAYFGSRGIPIGIYRGTLEWFSRQDRKDYFEGIDEYLLTDSLVFLDPDNGLEVKSSKENHVLFDEVADIYHRMGDNSVLMIFQCFPRQDHQAYLRKREQELCEHTGRLPIYISDNQIVFFLLTKKEDVRRELASTIIAYRSHYPCLTAGNAGSG